MAGPLTIQRVPRGLLHALAMKGTGDLPTELAPAVVAMYDVTALYLGDNIRNTTLATSQPITADAWYSAPGLGPQPGEIWLPINVTVQSGGSVGDTGSAMLGYIRKFTNGVLLLHTNKLAYTPTVDLVGGVSIGLGNLVLYPGDAVGIIATDGSAWSGAKNPTITVDYYRLEI